MKDNIFDDTRLRSLDDVNDFDVADGEPDPRGWDVVAADQRRIGEVDDLIFDPTSMKVVFLDVEVDEKGLGLERGDRHLLVPVRDARLDEDDERVHIDTVHSDRLAPISGRVELGAVVAVTDVPDRETGSRPTLREAIIVRQRKSDAL